MEDHKGHFDGIKLILGSILFGLGILFRSQEIVSSILFLVSYLIVGYEVLINAFRNSIKGEWFDENFLMTIATIGAFLIGSAMEGAAVILFFELGEYIQGKAVSKSRNAITSLMELKSEKATRKINGEHIVVHPSQIEVGEMIVVGPGERIPLDGIVVKGSSHLDTSMITGESVPRSVYEQTEVMSGCINLDGVLEIEVTNIYEESTVSRMLQLIEQVSEKKTTTERFITKFSKIYTPIVVLLALLLIFIPTIIWGDIGTWVYRALVFLVISCPCALVISIPLGFFSGIGKCSKQGILVKGSNELEGLAELNGVVFDKTGTLTEGIFDVTKIIPHKKGNTRKELLEYAAYGEYYSNHPIAVSIKKAYGKEIKVDRISNYEEIRGRGIRYQLDQDQLLIGNDQFLLEQDISVQPVSEVGTIVYVALNQVWIGTIVIADRLKQEVHQMIFELRHQGISNFGLLSGDNEIIVKKMSEEIGITHAYANLLPQDKVTKLEELVKDNEDGGKIAYVGDGMNDAPVLMAADVGISLGSIGSDAAIEASDIVIMDDSLLKIPLGVRIAKKTKKIVWQNIIFAIVVKVVVLGLGAFGYSEIWGAVFADVGVTLLVILNSLRIFK